MTKHKKTRKHQRGGDWNPMTWFNASPTRSWGDWFNGVSSQTKNSLSNISSGVENAISSATSFSTNSATATAPAYVPASTQQPTYSTEYTQQPTNSAEYTQQPSYGGKRRRRKSLKGGTSVAYYASPVHNMKVAEPTSWLHYGNGPNQCVSKGGTRKRRRTRKLKR